MKGPLRELPDKDLVVAFQAGDPNAYEEMYRRYAARVTNTCWRMLRNSDDAKEATQETFLKAYTALPRFNGNYQLGAWFSRIAVNACLDQIRARNRTGPLAALPSEPEALRSDIGPEELVAGGDARVDETIDELSPLHARALLMRGIEGLSHEEIASRLQMTAPQVKALLHRARTSFKKVWKQASGWAIAPVVNLKALLSEHARSASGASPHVAALSTSAAPVFAERMAASAMIVAVAITGATAGSVLDAPTDRARSAAGQLVAPSTSGTDDVLSAGEHHERVTTESVAARVRRTTSLIDALKEAVEQTSESSTPEEPDEDDGDYRGDEDKDLGLGDSTSATRAARRTAKQVASKVDDILP